MIEYEAGPVISFAVVEGEPIGKPPGAVEGSVLGGGAVLKSSGCEVPCEAWGGIESSAGGVGSRASIVVGLRDGVTWIIYGVIKIMC